MDLKRVGTFACLAAALLLGAGTAAADQEATLQKIMPSPGAPLVDAILVPLDNTGIADQAFLNPRHPPALRRNGQVPTAIRFENQTFDRTIQVTVNYPCVQPATNNRCEYDKISTNPQEWSEFDTSVIDTTQPANIAIILSVKFFDPTDTPTRQVGYLTIAGQEVPQRAGLPAAISILGAIGGTIDPLIPTKDEPDPNNPGKTLPKPIIDLDHPYEGAQRNHFTGSGKVDFFYPLGNRADGKLTLGFKEGDLGANPDDSGNKLTTKQYVFNVYALNGMSLRFGRTVFAQPANSIAVQESGDGFQINAGRFSLTHIIRRESAGGIAAADNEDHQVSIGQLTNAPFPGSHLLRRYSLLILYGEEDKRGKERAYDTFGGEVFFGSARAQIGGNVAAFVSHNRLKDSSLPDGEGQVALLTLTKFITAPATGGLGPRVVNRSFSALAGFGSGDDPTTPERESYIGETAAYAKDSIFLSAFGKPLETGGTANVLRGLANKNYYGFQYSENKYNLLEWIATELIGINKSDIVSRGTTLSLHDYSFREPVFGSTDAGWEADLEIFVQTPKNVKVKIGGAYFSPGRAMDDLIHDDSWAATTSVSIEL